MADGGVDLIPEGVEAVRNVQKQHLGLRPGCELLGRLGQNDVWPELTRTRELLLRGTPPGWQVVAGSEELALDNDILKRSLDSGRVE